MTRCVITLLLHISLLVSQDFFLLIMADRKEISLVLYLEGVFNGCSFYKMLSLKKYCLDESYKFMLKSITFYHGWDKHFIQMLKWQ